MLGEPSRFFYCAKASKKERNEGLDALPDVKTSRMNTANGSEEAGESWHPIDERTDLVLNLIGEKNEQRN